MFWKTAFKARGAPKVYTVEHIVIKIVVIFFNVTKKVFFFHLDLTGSLGAKDNFFPFNKKCNHETILNNLLLKISPNDDEMYILFASYYE